VGTSYFMLHIKNLSSGVSHWTQKSLCCAHITLCRETSLIPTSDKVCRNLCCQDQSCTARYINTGAGAQPPLRTSMNTACHGTGLKRITKSIHPHNTNSTRKHHTTHMPPTFVCKHEYCLPWCRTEENNKKHSSIQHKFHTQAPHNTHAPHLCVQAWIPLAMVQDWREQQIAFTHTT